MPSRGRPITITDEHLLDVAKTVFVEQGVSTTISEIARRADISESVLFHRFKTKEGVYLAVLNRQTRLPPILERIGERAGKGTVARQLLEIGSGMIEEMNAIVPFFMVASMMARAENWKLDELRERMNQPHPAQRETLARISGYLESEAKLGRLRKIDSEILAQVFLSSLVQYVLQQMMPGSFGMMPIPAPTFLEGLIDLLLHGVLPSPKPSEDK